MSTQLSILDAIAEGERLAKDGLARAVDTAEREHPGWKDRCWNLFVEWLFNKPAGYRFMIEDFRLHVECQKKLEHPNSKRAYGFLSLKARKLQLITPAGIAKVKNPDAHRANATMWCVI